MKDRRRGRRFPIECAVSFQVLGDRGPARQRCGTTVNIGSRGVLLAVDSPVAEGALVRLSLQWPVKLDDRCDLKLIMCGSVVRSEGDRIAVLIQKHEFRMAGRGGLFLVQRCPAPPPETAAPMRRAGLEAAPQIA